MNNKGIAPLIVVGLTALVGIFGYLAIPRVAAHIKLHAAEKNVVKTGDAAASADAKATQAAVNTGRGIQREATQAGAALGLLPDSPQKTFIGARLNNIQVFSTSLYGDADTASVEQWRQLALNAFSENAKVREEANARIAAQDANIKTLIGELNDARQAKEASDLRAKAARDQLIKAQADSDEKNGVIAMLKFGILVALILWAASWLLGVLAKSNPAFATASNVLHAIVAPGLLLLHTATSKASAAFEDRVGTFFGRVRAEMPDVATKVRTLGDEVFDDVHKTKIGAVADEIHKDAILARDEAKKLLGVP